MYKIPDSEDLVKNKRVLPPISDERKKMLVQATAWLERTICEIRIPNALKEWAKNNRPTEQGLVMAFGGDIKQGVKHKLYTFVYWDPEEQKGRLVNERPKDHPETIWYFGLNYLMLGGEEKKIGNRAFSHETINIVPVMERLRNNQDFKDKRFIFSLTNSKDQKTGRVSRWYLKIHWGEDRDRIMQFRQHKKSANKPKISPKKPILGKPVGKVKALEEEKDE